MSEKFFPYKNLGVQDSFTKTVEIVKTDNEKYSSTGSYFVVPRSVGKQNILNYPSGTTEVWIRFDLYIAHSGGYNNPPCVGHYVNGCEDGIRFNNGTIERIYANSTKLDFSYSVLLTGLHSYVLHMRAGDSETGKIEVSVDGSTILSETCEVAQLNGGIFSGACFFSNDHAYCFSDVVISDQQIAETDHGYNDERVMFYTSRNVSNVTLGTFDTSRNVKNGYFVDQPFDTVRRVKGNINISFDTLRDVSNYLISAHYDGDLIRNVTKDVDASFDTKREVVPTADISFDTFREVDKTVEIEIPVKRTSWQDIDESFYTNRKIAFNFGKVEDRIGKDGGYHLRSIVLNLAANTLSDKITCEVAAHMKPNDAMIGSLLDYAFDMMVESATYKGLAPSIDGDSYLQRVTSMYKMDALLTLPRRLRLVRYSKFAKQNNLEWVTYSETTAEAKNAANKEISSINLKYTGQTIALSIAKSLGLIPAIYFDNFKSDTAYSLKSQTTFKAMLSQNFGWTTSLPWRQINIFIRKNVLCFVQRGKEPNEINLDGYSTTIPQVTLSIYRTEWNLVDNDSTSASSANGGNGGGGFTVDWPDESGDDKDKNKNDSVPLPTPEYFSGTLICGNTKLVYERGLCVSKTVLSPMDMKTVDYYSEMSYDAERRMTDKHEYSSEEGYTDTHIDYAGDSDNSSNTTTETKYDESGDVSSVVVTVSVDLGNGFVGVSTFVDGEYQGSSISGSGVITTGQYQTNESNKKLSKGKNKWKLNDDDLGTLNKTYKIPQPLYSSSLPKSDPSLLQLFADEIRSYNRSIQETISLNVISPVVNGKIKDKHIIDFTDRILYRGNTYYLESNTVTLNTSSFTQALTFTRWRR